jgi:hypothetical protein
MEDRHSVNDGSQVIGELLHHGPAGRRGVREVKGKWASETPAGWERGGETRVILLPYLSLNQPRQVAGASPRPSLLSRRTARAVETREGSSWCEEEGVNQSADQPFLHPSLAYRAPPNPLPPPPYTLHHLHALPSLCAIPPPPHTHSCPNPTPQFSPSIPFLPLPLIEGRLNRYEPASPIQDRKLYSSH